MKITVITSLALALVAGAAQAQVAPPQPPVGQRAPAADAAVAPPPAPGKPAVDAAAGAVPPPGDAAIDMGPPPPPGGPRRPLPPPSKAAHFRLEGSGERVDVKCAEDEPTRACTDAALELMDHFQNRRP